MTTPTRRDLTAGLAPGKWWTNQTIDERATVVNEFGSRSTGRIICWYAPGECELDTGVRGVLLETWERRKGAES